VAAWRALSELFLDTAMDDRDIALIANRLRETGIPVGELEYIYEQEVAPACWRNLTAVPGGVWTGFDDQWLTAVIQQTQRRQSWWNRWFWVKRLSIKRWTALTREEWNCVRKLLT
jgi:hypothetical protein